MDGCGRLEIGNQMSKAQLFSLYHVLGYFRNPDEITSPEIAARENTAFEMMLQRAISDQGMIQ